MALLNWRVQKLDITTSTNDEVRRAAAAGEVEGFAVVAEQQTAGRGRQDRVWESPKGNLYCSVLLKPNDMPRTAGLYSFVVALAVRDTLRHLLPESVLTLKWPNDVLANGKKISGILLEVAGDILIVGVGINVASYPGATLYPATSLVAEGAKSTDLTELLNRFLESLNIWHPRLPSDGFQPVREAWLAHAQKGAMTVRLPRETVQGTFGGLDENGCLRLLLADGAERSISTGDVLFVSKEL